MELSVEFVCASIFTSLCILLAFIYRHLCKQYTYFEKKEVSGPVPSLFFGTWKESLGKFLGDLDIQNAKIYGKNYGTYDGFTPNLMVLEPNAIKKVLLTDADKFIDARVSTCKNPILQKSLSSLYVERESEVQALLNEVLSDTNVRKLIPKLDSPLENLRQKIIQLEDGNINLMPQLNEYVYEVVASLVFGIDFSSGIKDEFIGHCDTIFTVKEPNSKLALISFLYEQFQGESWIFPSKALNFFVDLIKTKIRDSPKGQVTDEQGNSTNLIDLLVQASEEEKNLVKTDIETKAQDFILTEEFIVVKCVSVILNIINMTRTMIFSTIRCLSDEQEIQKKVRREIIQIREKETLLDFQNTQYLDMTIFEALRLYPIEFRLEMICKEPVTVSNINLEAGNRVSIPLYALHRQQDYFHEPEKYDPERFLGEEIAKRDPYTYILFGHVGASNYSIASQLAQLIAKKTVIFLIKNFVIFKAEENGNNSEAMFKLGATGVPKPQFLYIRRDLYENIQTDTVENI